MKILLTGTAGFIGSYVALRLLQRGADGIRAYGKPASILYDVKYVLPREAVDGRL